MMMTRLASVAKKSQSPRLWAITSRALSNLKINCLNSETKKGLGINALEDFKTQLLENRRLLLDLRYNKYDQSDNVNYECNVTHTIVRDTFLDVMDTLDEVEEVIKKAEAKLVANSLKSNPTFRGISWNDLF